MKLKKKMILIWTGILIISLLLQCLWGIAITSRNTEEKIRSELYSTLESYINNTLVTRQMILSENRLDTVGSYVYEYQRSALEIAGQIATYTHIQFIIFNSSGELLFDSGSAEDPFIRQVWNSASGLLAGDSGNRAFHDTISGGIIIAGTLFVPWDWVVVTTDRDNTAASQIQQIVLGTVLLLSVVLIATIIIMMLITQHVILNPIKILHETSHQLSRGDYPETIDISGSDVFGELARTMESMARTLKRNQDDLITLNSSLEQSVAEKTRELQAKSLQLEHENTALRALENQYRSIFDYSPDAIFINRDNRIYLANQASAHLLGAASPDMLLDRDIYSFYEPAYHSVLTEHNRRALADGLPVTVPEEHIIRLDGTLVEVETIITPFTLKKSQALHMIMRNISEQKQLLDEKDRLQKQVTDAQKMELISQLAGGIAHDFNNMLSGLLGNIELAKMEAPDNSPIHTYLNQAFSAYERAKNLTSQLLTFSKSSSISTVTTDMRKVISDSTEFTLAGSNVTVEYDLDETLWYCDVDTNQMAQVIDNIILNAKQALKDTGVIRITAKNTALNKHNPQQLEDGEYVRISIADNGSGIPDAIKSKIFEPFYTTKNNGTGLGLSSSLSIVMKHKGTITVEASEREGTVFTIFLPRSKSLDIDNSLDDREGFHGEGKILILDDNEAVRAVLSAMLSSLGYEVIEANDGQDIVDMCHQRLHDPVLDQKFSSMQAAFFDLTIPGGVGGREVIERTRECCPRNIPIIAISGYSDDDIITNPVRYGFTDSIQKPFTRKELVGVLSKYCKQPHR